MLFIANINCQLLSKETFETYQQITNLADSHKTNETSEEKANEKPESMNTPDSYFYENKSEFYNWVARLAVEQKQKIEEISKDEMIFPNNCYAASPGSTFDKTLIEIFSMLPITSSIMCNAFRRPSTTPTSSTTEAYFNVVKNSVFKSMQNIRIDTWLETHLRYLQGKLKADAKNTDHFSSFDEEICTDDLIIEKSVDDDSDDEKSDQNEYIEHMSHRNDEKSCEPSNFKEAESSPKFDPYDSKVKQK